MQGWLQKAREATILAAGKAAEAAEEAARSASTVTAEAFGRPEGESLGIMESLGLDPLNTVTDSKFVARRPTQAELDSLDLVYITPTIVAMAFPIDPVRRKAGRCKASKGNDINVVANYLKMKHPGRFMIWNVSEDTYDYSRFDNQVLEYFFPGHPAPPLGLLFKICTSMDSWLAAAQGERDASGLPSVELDEDFESKANVAVVHCLSGKGRTATVLACYLAWSGVALSPMEGLQLVCDRKQREMEDLTIPSQRRYLQYFTNMLDGVKPRSEPLLLRRCIMNTIPSIGDQKGNLESRNSPRPTAQGCRPYLQVFKGGVLLFTTAWNSSDIKSTAAQATEESSNEIPWCYSSDESIVFPINAPVQGDILVRLRHHASDGARVTMFRAGFHTGYVPSGVLRLTKSQLDGACNDNRFDSGFFIDLIFAPIDEEEAARQATDVLTDKGLDIASADRKDFDDMLHKDARFWDEIAKRKAQRSEQAAALQKQVGKSLRGTGANFTIDEEPTAPAAEQLFAPSAEIDNAALLAQLNEAEEEVGASQTAEGVEETAPQSISMKEIAELDSLQKSLGLDDFDLDFDDGVGAGDGTAEDMEGGDVLDLDEDLDGLESYLQNLAATGLGVEDEGENENQKDQV